MFRGNNVPGLQNCRQVFFRSRRHRFDREVVDENLQDTEDFRADWLVSLGFNLTKGLAFKTSYQMLFDNAPALIGVDLFNQAGTPLNQTVTTPTKEVDSFLTLSLVIKL